MRNPCSYTDLKYEVNVNNKIDLKKVPGSFIYYFIRDNITS